MRRDLTEQAVHAHIHAMYAIDAAVRGVLRKTYRTRTTEGAFDDITFPSRAIAEAYKRDYIELTRIHLADYTDKYPERREPQCL